MPKITLSIDQNMLASGREFARKQDMSLNELIRRLLAETVRPGSKDWLEESFRLADRAKLRPVTRRWQRSELYDL